MRLLPLPAFNDNYIWALTGDAGATLIVDPGDAYLGRTCPYRECRPGIRTSCRARHCGRRPYLNDDLDVLNLPADVIAAPPLDLWPRVIARAELPPDVRELADAR